MRKRLLLSIIAILSLVTGGIFLLTLFYIDPLINPLLGIIILAFSGIVSIACCITLLLYFMKKIYYRGEVYIYHVLSSFRLGFFVGLFVTGLVFLKSFGVFNFLSASILGLFFIFSELFIASIKHKE